MSEAHVLWRRAAGIARQPAFRAGVHDLMMTMPGISAWGLVTGVAMVKSGLPVPLAVFMSLTVYAGSAQLAVLPLLAVGAPLWVMWFTAFCVNLRFVILSAMWRTFFDHLRLRHRMTLAYFSGDVIFVAFAKRYPEPVKQDEQLAYFWGGAMTNWVGWQIPSLAGIFLANVIPLEWGLGFAGVLALLGVLYSMMNTRATWLACAVASAVAVWAYALPLKLNILTAIVVAVVVGLLMESAERHTARLRPQPAVRPPNPAHGEQHAVLPLADEGIAPGAAAAKPKSAGAAHPEERA